MADKIPTKLRKQIRERARDNCEYCLLPQTFATHKHEPDHIIPVQHEGITSFDNLALACFYCNRYKGPNVGSFDSETGLLTPFFHPRNQIWEKHFQINAGMIIPLSAEARVTIKILQINNPIRVRQRNLLQKSGLI